MQINYEVFSLFFSIHAELSSKPKKLNISFSLSADNLSSLNRFLMIQAYCFVQ